MHHAYALEVRSSFPSSTRSPILTVHYAVTCTTQRIHARSSCSGLAEVPILIVRYAAAYTTHTRRLAQCTSNHRYVCPGLRFQRKIWHGRNYARPAAACARCCSASVRRERFRDTQKRQKHPLLTLLRRAAQRRPNHTSNSPSNIL